MITVERLITEAEHLYLIGGELSDADAALVKTYRSTLTPAQLVIYLGSASKFSFSNRNMVYIVGLTAGVTFDELRKGIEEATEIVKTNIMNGINSDVDFKSLAAIMILNDLYHINYDFSTLDSCDLLSSDFKHWRHIAALCARFSLHSLKSFSDLVAFRKLKTYDGDEWTDYDFNY